MMCLTCGDKGYTSAYVYCVKCKEVGVHRYCLDKVTFDEYVHWVCDDCGVNEQDRRLTVFNGKLPNEHEHGGLERSKPVIDFIWRGNFKFWNKKLEKFDGFVVAHPSVKACPKVFQEASLFPPLLQLEMLPKADIWPKSFTTSEPSDDNIALYFFPHDTRCRKGFDQLVEEMINEDLALRATVTNAELLVFASTELPLSYWRFQGKYYLWGVFKGKRDSTRHKLTPNGSGSAVIHRSPGNELAVTAGGDDGNAKTWNVRRSFSPLSNSAASLVSHIS